MATYFVIADIHSYYDIMIQALEKIGFDINNKNHILISLGDLFDRGNKSKECLSFINSLPNNRKILIRGNHEDLLEEALDRGYLRSHDFHNGTDKTINQLSECYDDDNIAIQKCREDKELKKYLDSCIDYFETDDYIFVHGWIPNDGVYDDNWRNGNWKDARWKCGFDCWDNKIIVPNKTIVCGHWHTSYAHHKYHHFGNEWEDEWVRVWNVLYKDTQIKNTACFDIFKDDGIIGLDACTVYSGKVNILKIGKQKKLND